MFNLSIFCNWGRIQGRELAFSLVFWIGFSITSTGLDSVGMRWLLEESGLLAGLVDAWTGAELAGKLPDSVVGGKAPLPFTAPFTPKKNTKQSDWLLSHCPQVRLYYIWVLNVLCFILELVPGHKRLVSNQTSYISKVKVQYVQVTKNKLNSYL